MTDTGPALVVPIDLQALCVGETDVNGSLEDSYGTKDFAEIRSDFSTLPFVAADGTRVNEKANIGEAVLPSLFQPSSSPLEQGIHLHWALPDALTHGASNAANGRIGFPDAPSRWIVVRIASCHPKDAAPKASIAAWVVESDHLWDKWSGESMKDAAGRNASSRAIPIEPKPMARPNRAYLAMGRVFPYETWTDSRNGLYMSRHTAVGYGTETYAAAYLHSQNVFGFHDTLEDLKLQEFPPADTSVSYMVAGWYNGGGDPLKTIAYPQDATNAQKRAAIAQAYKWTFDGGDDGPVPAATICNGLLYGIRWDPKGTHYISERVPHPVTLAIGNTTVEALSALVASDADTESAHVDVETTLNAFQLGLLANLGQPGGMADLEDTLHRTGFAGIQSGKMWTLVGPQPTDVGSQDLLDAAAASGATLPKPIATRLHCLNMAQRDVDRALEELDARRSLLFADWIRYAVLRHDMPYENPTGISWEQAYQYLVAAIEPVKAAFDALCPLVKRRNHHKRKLRRVLRKKSLSLRAARGPRYWQPREPVVLLSGDDLHPPQRYGGDGRFDPAAGTLACRLSTSIVKSMTMADGKVVSAADLPGLPPSPNASYATELAALTGEAFFLDPNQAALLAARARPKGAADSAAPIGGVMPSPVGVHQWEHPWIPILLQWRVSYHPLLPVGDGDHAVAAYPDGFVKTNYVLDADDIDLVPRQPTPVTFPVYQTYSGMIVLSRNVEIDLRAQIKEYLKHYPDPGSDLEKIANGPPLSAMAQSLSGFNQSLLMRGQTLQLMVSDPLALRLDGYMRANFVNNDLAGAIADANDLAPVPFGCYNPIRGGYMTVDGLRVIDAFGQVIDVTDLRVVRASALVPHDEKEDAPTRLIALGPRLAQPARLMFRWISATDDLVELNSHPATSPVCGWVLFNHVDQSLMVYDAAGNAAGSLNVQGDIWRPAPGPAPAPITNAHLAGFVDAITNRADGADFLDDLLKAIDATATSVTPLGYKQDPGLAVLIGRPLALVRATLNLEVQGLPAANQSWEAFARAVNAGDANTRDTAAFAGVNIPVRLGDLSRVDDGLIGYFVEDQAGTTYRTFYAAASTHTSHGVVPPEADRLTVKAAPDAQPATLTMLVDPRAPVHATTGMLPGKRIEIPPEMYTAALNRMAVTFLTAPVLTLPDAFAIPLPSEPGYDWSWLAPPEKDGGAWVERRDLIAPNPKTSVVTAPQELHDGWLKLSKRATTKDGAS